MSTLTESLLPLLGIALCIWFVLQLNSKLRNAEKYPPGPRPLPVIGNMLDFPVPDSNAWRVYREWSVKCKSDIVFASALGSNVLVLNKRKDAFALLDNRSDRYSNRPSIPMIEMLGWDRNISLMQYGSFWRLHRRVCQEHFRKEVAPDSYNPVQIAKMKAFLNNLLQDPQAFKDYIKLFSIAVPLATIYGYDVNSVTDPCVEAADQSVFIAGKLLLPGGSLINVFPFLRHLPIWFPGAGAKAIAQEGKRLTEQIVRLPLDDLKRRMDAGAVPSSIMSDFLERKAQYGTGKIEEQVYLNVAYTVYGAASDTVASALETFIYAMAIYPDVQHRAQAEIDGLLGASRLPLFNDREALPYVEAIYREVLRWKPPVATGVPHLVTGGDDYYKGYVIPNGTTVIPNIAAMCRDEELYDEPEEFRPGRFINADGSLNGDSRVLAYGFGRRLCVGKHVGSSTTWIAIACILAAFDIGKAKDENGCEIPINDEYESLSGFIISKKAFRCSITPRSDRARELIQE